MNKQRKKTIAPRKMLKRVRKKIPISEEYWSGLHFTYPQFKKWNNNFRLVFTATQPYVDMYRKRLEKHGYSFEMLEKNHPELVGNVLELVRLWEKDMPKQMDLSKLRNDKEAFRARIKEREKWIGEFRENIMPSLYELYKILGAKSFSNLELCGSVRPEERYVVK